MLSLFNNFIVFEFVFFNMIIIIIHVIFNLVRLVECLDFQMIEMRPTKTNCYPYKNLNSCLITMTIIVRVSDS